MENTLFVKRFDTGTTAEVSEDFTIPDYQPEMRRVVGVRATPTVDGKYLSGDELEADGGVTYTVLYVGGNGELSQISQTSSYTGRIPVKTEDDRFSVGDLILGASIDGVNCRVTGPRKFTLSSRVKLNLISQKPVDVSLKVEKTDGGQTPDTRRKTETHNTACICEVRKNAEVSGEIREREGMKVVCAQGDIALYDMHIDQQNKKSAVVKGDAFVTVLLLSPDGDYVTARGRSPIEEVVQLGDIRAGALVYGAAFGNVALLELEVGENGTISWQMEYDIDCDIMRCTSSEATVDAYLTGFDDKLTKEIYNSYMPACAMNGRLTTSGAAKLRPDMSYVCAWGSAVADKCEISGGRMMIGGGVKITVVTAGSGEVVAEDVLIPLKYECEALPGAIDCGSMAKRVQISVSDVNARVDGDTVNITAELAISCIALATEQIEAAVSIAPTQSDSFLKNRDNVIRVYVPDENETAWDVEKRFRLKKEATSHDGAYVI